MKRYSYSGPVMIFGNCVNWNWRGETTAESLNKARSNLAFQYKKQTGRSADTRVRLTGKIREME